MSTPGPVRPRRAVAPRRLEDVRSGAGAERGQRRVPAGRDPRPRRRERVREIDLARHRERLPRPGRGSRRDRGSRPGQGIACGGTAPRARHRVPGLLARPRPVGRREPLPRRARGRAADLRAAWRVGGGDARASSTSTSPSTPLTGSLPLAERQLLEVAKALLPSRRCCSSTSRPRRSGRRTSSASTHSYSSRSGRESRRLRQSPPSRGPRGRGPRHCAPRRRRAGDVRGGIGLGGEPRRADDRPAAHRRIPGATRAPEQRDRARRLGLPGSASALSIWRSGRERSSGLRAPKATVRCRSCARSPASSPRSAARSCDGAKLDALAAGPLRAGVVLLSGDRRGEALFPVLSVRANATVQVLGRLARAGIVRRGRERARSKGSWSACESAWRRRNSPCNRSPAATSRRCRSSVRSCAETSR